MENEKSIFEQLNSISVNGHTEEKNGLTYLSWAWAWSELKKLYPNATYTIERFGEDKKPYLYDENLGYMVFTSMTINELTHDMWLPVMDSQNKAMKDKSYTYDTKYKKGLKVESATMFDINKTIMRCLVKNIGMFGLGLYIYAGEDLPEDLKNEQTQTTRNIVENKIDELKSLGVNVNDKSFMEYIAQKNNGKNDINTMNDEEVNQYIKVLEAIIQNKRNASNSK